MVKRIKGYSTKYALTTGIQPCTVEPLEDNPKYVATCGRLHQLLVRGRTFFESLDEAFLNAKEQAERKLKSLEKARRKLEVIALDPVVSKEPLK